MGLREETLKALIWNGLQRYGTLFISFLSNIVLARFLSPDDYGLVGLMTVFTAVATSIVDSGFGSALIQRRNITQADFCTVFYWNICISSVIYLILFALADKIAGYFSQPRLAEILRIQSITLIINAFCVVQTAKLTKYLKFKSLAFRTIVGNFSGACVGIVLAIFGFGVWSLVFQVLTSAFVSALLIWYIADWRPTLIFSLPSFRDMYKFGGYIFVTGICDTLYTNLLSFIIGRHFSIRDLGLYTQAKKLENVPVDGTSSVLGQVLFPVYASIASDRRRHKELVRKNVTVITYLTFPLMTLLIVIAEPLISILFGERWIDCVPMFQILCIFGMFSPLNRANSQIFSSIGNGKVYMILQISKCVIALIMVLSLMRYGIYPFLCACAAAGITSYSVNLFFTHRFFGYSYKEQLADILPNFLVSVAVCLVSLYIMHVLPITESVSRLAIGVLIFLCMYIFSTHIFMLRGYNLCKEVICLKKRFNMH